jgi:probable F420-dependent oxidoreductase
MMVLARDRSKGAHTYHVPVEHTAQAREILGAGPFLGVEQTVLFETDPTKARETARAHLGPFLTAGYNLAKFRRLGYPEADIDTVSDRIVDDLVSWGDLEMITAKLSRHIAAGADHVAVQVIGVESNDAAMLRWRELADALL